MPRNTLDDLTNHLFEQIENLKDDDCTKEQIHKAVAISKLSTNVINIKKLQFNAIKYAQRLKSIGEDDQNILGLIPGEK